MSRYLKLYFTCAKRSLVSRMEYKKDFFIATLSFLLANACSIVSIYFMVSSIPELRIEGEVWSFDKLGFLYGFAMMPVALDHLITDDLWLCAYYKIKTGAMDTYYLRPVPVLFQVIAETFQPEAFGEVIVGVVMLTVCGFMTNISLTPALVILLIVATIFGAIIITALKIICTALSFLFKRSGPLLQIVYNFNQYARYPLKMYPKAIQMLLMFVIPFGLIITLPVEAIFVQNSFNPWLLSLIIIGVSIGLLTIAIFIWSVCAKRYKSSGS